MPKISIVDDDVWSRDGIRELIEFLESGFITETTCLITDLQMQGLSGLDLQRQLLGEGHNVPIIFVTAYPDDGRRKYALDAGAIGFFNKPLDEQTFIDCLTFAVDLSRKNGGPP